MIVSAIERREVLKLYNVSEAARIIEVDVQHLHRDVKAGIVFAPATRLGRRSYYKESDLEKLSSHYARKKS